MADSSKASMDTAQAESGNSAAPTSDAVNKARAAKAQTDTAKTGSPQPDGHLSSRFTAEG